MVVCMGNKYIRDTICCFLVQIVFIMVGEALWIESTLMEARDHGMLARRMIGGWSGGYREAMWIY